jgi:hypothetical protein
MRGGGNDTSHNVMLVYLQQYTINPLLIPVMHGGYHMHHLLLEHAVATTCTICSFDAQWLPHAPPAP